MVEQKEIEEFVVRFAGAMVGGLEDAAFEAYWIMDPAVHGQFPYTKLHPLLPNSDDLIVGGLAIPPWVIGALLEEDAKKKGLTKEQQGARILKMFGEGDAIYALNMNLYHTLTNVLSPAAAARFGARRSAPRGAPGGAGGAGRKTDVGHRIVKL